MLGFHVDNGFIQKVLGIALSVIYALVFKAVSVMV
jgi:hypothetical protein